jgi:hypothetical protein
MPMPMIGLPRLISRLMRLACLVWLMCFWAGPAAAQTPAPFDHLRTGFALTGAHNQVRCEACHQNGVLKGTPRDCASCHLSGQRLARGNVVMTGNHLPTSLACDSCHTTKSFSGARFDHQGVAAGSCVSCHNGARASGRSANHVPYQTVGAAANAACDSCHKAGFTSWSGARFHANVSVGTGCASCHSGAVQGAVGKPATPIHAGVTACESCHATTGWAGAKVDHAGFNASTNCASCHNGGAATGKPGAHIPVGSSNCFSCHAVSGWKPTKWNHTQLTVAGQCATCHTGGYPPASGRSTKHVPYTSVAAFASANCDSCHKSGSGSWTPAKVHTSASVASGCATCHSGGFAPAVGKPSNALHATVTGTCESCHKSTSTWSGAKVDHSGYNAATNCASCHNGSTATGKSGTHIPVGSTNCFSCHATTGWAPTKWNHTQTTVAGQCASCHTGGFPPADGRSANHVPYASVPATASANCDSCHKSGFGTWAPAKVHASTSISTNCANCHTGGFPPAAGKPSNALHASVTGNCESCHKSTSTWSSAKVDHSGYNAATNCASCHNGSTATGKSGTHIPVGSTNCFSCHATTGWAPTKWNHTQTTVTAQCASCHTGGYPPADGRSATHVPYASVPALAAANCDTCHKSGYSAWATAKVHANASISTSCASCHTGAYSPAVGKPSNSTHASVTGNCESCHKSTSTWSSAKVDHSTFSAATNCASCHNGNPTTGKPAAHIPVGSTNCFSCHGVTGWTPTKWNHTQTTVTAQCASCHTGGYPPADGRSATHVPYASVPATAAANCDTCHKSGYTAWAPAKVHANASISTSCASCHTGAYSPAVGKPSNSTHAAVTGNCESCHKSTSNWSSAKVDHSTFSAATNCASCHNGNPTTGKPGTHIPVGATNCFSCHGVTGWTPAKWNHTQMPVAAQCATCHTGGYPPADGRRANHVPYQAVATTAAANCDTCHKSGFAAWTPARVHTNASISTSCATCHTGAYAPAVGKPSNTTHATVTGNCESCHKSTSTWSGAKVDHGSFNAATTCASCHNGNPTPGKPASHMPVGATNCFNCHSVTGWTPTKWNHTQLVVTAACATCHSGGYPPADGRGNNHIPYATVAVAAAANCDACHKGSTSTWANGRFHANFSVSIGCASCHTGSYLGARAKPANATHASVTGNCESCHKSTASWSTVSFGHSPANAVGTGTCDTCHVGGGVTGKPANHIPVPAGTARCDSCHRSQTSWKTAMTMNHTVVGTATCKSCHNGSYTGAGTQGALAKPGNHIPEVQLLAGATMDCKACHTSTTSWGTQKMNHNSSPGNGAGWCKACHQSGTNYAGSMERKSLTHEKSTGVTDCSQSGCHRPLGNKGTAYTKWE